MRNHHLSKDSVRDVISQPRHLRPTQVKQSLACSDVALL